MLHTAYTKEELGDWARDYRVESEGGNPYGMSAKPDWKERDAAKYLDELDEVAPEIAARVWQVIESSGVHINFWDLFAVAQFVTGSHDGASYFEALNRVHSKLLRAGLSMAWLLGWEASAAPWSDPTAPRSAARIRKLSGGRQE